MPRKFFRNPDTGAVVAVTVVSRYPLDPRELRAQVAKAMRWTRLQKIKAIQFRSVEREHLGEAAETRSEFVDHLTILVHKEFYSGRRSVEERIKARADGKDKNSPKTTLRKDQYYQPER